jgi:hypothetical protein
MTKYLLAADDKDQQHLTHILMGYTGDGAYQLMANNVYTGLLTLNKKSGKTENLRTAMWQTTAHSTFAHGVVHTRLYNAFNSVNDASLINETLGAAPVSNSKTQLIHAIAGTPEFITSTLKETVWGVRRIVDPNLGLWEVGNAGAEMDIPTYRGKSIFVSAVALGRAFGLDKNELDHGPMAKFNHRIGKSKGPRKAWQRMGDNLEVAKLAAWNDYHNSGTGRLNKIEITPESVDTLATVIRRKIESTPVRSLDAFLPE